MHPDLRLTIIRMEKEHTTSCVRRPTDCTQAFHEIGITFSGLRVHEPLMIYEVDFLKFLINSWLSRPCNWMRDIYTLLWKLFVHIFVLITSLVAGKLLRKRGPTFHCNFSGPWAQHCWSSLPCIFLQNLCSLPCWKICDKCRVHRPPGCKVSEEGTFGLYFISCMDENGVVNLEILDNHDLARDHALGWPVDGVGNAKSFSRSIWLCRFDSPCGYRVMLESHFIHTCWVHLT